MPGAVPAGHHQPALRPPEHPRDRPQVLDRVGLLARRRSAADVELGDLVDRGDRAEEVDEARVVVDERAVRAVARWRRARPSSSTNSASGSPSCRRRRHDDSSVAASSVSRLRRASAGWAYLAATISPCSVTRIARSTEPGGWARIACVGRAAAASDRAAATVEQPQPHAGGCGRVDESALRREQVPLRRQVAAVLVRVGVADHHLLALAAASRRAGGTPGGRAAR